MEESFRNSTLAKSIVNQIERITPNYNIKFCHVCGTHEWTVTHYGIRYLLPKNLDVIAGPGCPVCVVPAKEIDEAIWLAMNGITVLTFGDMIRVPGSKISLFQAKAIGGHVKVVYSIKDAINMAKKNPNKEYVFFAVGFETTAPSNAVEILNNPPKNLSFLISHRLIPPIMELLLGIGDLQIDGFIAPGHVSTIIGMKPYEIFPKAYRMPTVIAGFEPLDVLFAICLLLKQINKGEAKLENEYTRAVKWEGNIKAQKVIEEVFEVTTGEWRGIGRVPFSALKLKNEFSYLDARLKYDIKVEHSRDLLQGCSCHLVIIGKIKPNECPLFMKACTPQSPKGPCMVSIEGTCTIWAKHGIY
ncbi:MAG: hydrogenase formation protein HypD [Candidatus Bathyarchaeia archaeon]